MSVSSSTDTPVRSPSCAKVTPPSAESRSNTGSSKEVERDLAAPDGGAQTVQWDPRGHEALDQLRPEHVTRREPTLGVGRDHSQIDQSAKLRGVDACPLGASASS